MNTCNDKVKRTIGLDCHPDSFTAAVVLGTHARTATVEKLSASLPLDQVEPWCSRNCGSEDVLVLEASANSFELYRRLTGLGLRVLVLDSMAVVRLGKRHSINDRISASRLARVYLSGLSDDVWVPDPVTAERREVFSSYTEAVKDCTRHTNRIRSFLNEHMMRLKKGMKPSSKGALEYVLSRRHWTDGQRMILEEAFLDLGRAYQKRHRLRRRMAEEIIEDPLLLRLNRIFGLKLITVYALMAMIGDINRFTTPKKLVAYFGLNPSFKDSGTSMRSGRISRAGRKDVRPLLVQAAHCVMQHRHSPLHRWGWALAFRKGMKLQAPHKDRGKKLAVIAVARKLVVATWYFLNGRPFKAEEENQTLSGKLRKLAELIGLERIKAMGCNSYSEFVNMKMNFLRETACNPT